MRRRQGAGAWLFAGCPLRVPVTEKNGASPSHWTHADHSCTGRAPSHARQKLFCDVKSDVDARVHRVAQVIHAVDFDNKDVLRVKPVAWPLVNEYERIATVLEAAIPTVVSLVHAKRVFPSKTGPETVIGNAATAIAPGALRLLCVSLVLLVVPVLLLRVVLFLPVVLVLLLRGSFFLLGVVFVLLSVLFFLLVVLVFLLGVIPFRSVLVLLLLRVFVFWLCGFIFLGFLVLWSRFVLVLLRIGKSSGSENQR